MDQSELDELSVESARSFITRLHVRYDHAHFPEDLQFQETPDTETFQSRFVIQVASKRRNTSTCAAGREYRQALHERWKAENATLASLTGWAPDDIHRDMVAHWERTREQ